MIDADKVFYRRALIALKKARGLSYKHLSLLAPRHYLVTDSGFPVDKHLLNLMTWGLVEGYKDGKCIVNANARSAQVSGLTFYISPLALELETQLGVTFGLSTAEVFGGGYSDGKSIDWPKVFVVMPFRDELLPVYTDHIVPIAQSMRMTIGRGDDVFSTTQVTHDIWRSIQNSSVVIADCTGRNANVFYEIGLAHAIGREVILISQSRDDIPFDLLHLRHIIYRYEPRAIKAFEQSLGKLLMQIVADEPVESFGGTP